MIRRQLLAQERCRKRLGHLHSCHQPMGDKPWFQKISNPSPSSRPTFSVSMKILNARSKRSQNWASDQKTCGINEIIMIYIYDIYPDENLNSLAGHKFQTMPLPSELAWKSSEINYRNRKVCQCLVPEVIPTNRWNCDASINKNV